MFAQAALSSNTTWMPVAEKAKIATFATAFENCIPVHCPANTNTKYFYCI